MIPVVKKGDTISVNYTGRFIDGKVFDSSDGRSPLKFTVGEGQLVRGFDNAVVGMQTGEKKTVTIAPAEGYGEYIDEKLLDIPKANIPDDMDLETGMHVQLADQEGRAVPAVVAEVVDEAIRLDLNHPLAGKTLIFDIEIVEIEL